jgi:alpha-mannosidase
MDLNDRIQVAGDSLRGKLPITVFNPLSWTRSAIMSQTVDIPKQLGIMQPGLFDGKRVIEADWLKIASTLVCKFNPYKGIPDWIPVDRYELTCSLPEIPPHGFRTFTIAESYSKPAAVGTHIVVDERTMVNEFLAIRVEDDGSATIQDKENGYTYNGLNVFRDISEAGNGFEHIPLENDMPIYSDRTASSVTIQTVRNSNLMGALEVRLEFPVPRGLDASRTSRSGEKVQLVVTSVLALTRSSRRVDVQTTVYNTAKDHMLEVLFPVDIQTDHYYAEQPFDVVKRQITQPPAELYNTATDQQFMDLSHELPSYLQPQLAFVDVSDNTHGFMVANRGICSAGVIDDARRTIALTLLRTTDRLYESQFTESLDTLIPEAQCAGDYTFDYALIPHSGSWSETVVDCREYEVPLQAKIKQTPIRRMIQKKVQTPKNLAPLWSFIDIAPNSIPVTSMKKCEARDSLILRSVNLHDEERRLQVRVNTPAGRFAGAYVCDLNETRGRGVETRPDGWVELPVQGRCIVTLEIELEWEKKG